MGLTSKVLPPMSGGSNYTPPRMGLGLSQGSPAAQPTQPTQATQGMGRMGGALQGAIAPQGGMGAITQSLFAGAPSGAPTAMPSQQPTAARPMPAPQMRATAQMLRGRRAY
jgi:hypothetical protein